MTKYNYARPKATADRLIARFGMTATLVQTSTTGGEPWDPGSGTTTTVETEVTVVSTVYSKSDIDGTLILATDRKVLMSVTGATVPSPADVLIMSGVSYSIVNVAPLAPAGVTVLFECQARG